MQIYHLNIPIVLFVPVKKIGSIITSLKQWLRIYMLPKYFRLVYSTHSDRVTHIGVGKLNIIIWTSAGIMLIEP